MKTNQEILSQLENIQNQINMIKENVTANPQEELFTFTAEQLVTFVKEMQTMYILSLIHI